MSSCDIRNGIIAGLLKNVIESKEKRGGIRDLIETRVVKNKNKKTIGKTKMKRRIFVFYNI